MRTRHYLIIGASCLITAAVIGPISYTEGKGPPITIQKVEAIGPAVMGERYGIRVWGNVRPGCVPFVARSFERWTLSGIYRVVEKQPITNIPAVSSLPPVPDALKSLPPAPYTDVYIPLPTKLTTGDDWYLMGEASGLYCEPWWRRILGTGKSQTFYAKTSIEYSKDKTQ